MLTRRSNAHRTRRLDGYRLYTATGSSSSTSLWWRSSTPSTPASDGGAVLLKAVDRQLGVTAAVARCLRDRGSPARSSTRCSSLVRQRIFGLDLRLRRLQRRRAAGRRCRCTSCLLDRDPLTGPALASQATLSRFENAVTSADADAAGHALGRPGDRAAAARGCRGGRGASRSTSIPPTTRPTASRSSPSSTATTTPGATCPCSGFVTLQRRGRAVPASWPCCGPGNGGGQAGGAAGCGALFRKLRAAFPGASGCACAWTAASPARTCWRFWRPRQVEYVVAMGGNRRLDKRAQRLMGRARMRVQDQRRDRASLRRDALRRRGSGRRKRRVIIKAEVVRHPGRDSQEQSAVRRDQPAAHPGSTSTRSTARGAMWRTGSRSSRTAWPWTA